MAYTHNAARNLLIRGSLSLSILLGGLLIVQFHCADCNSGTLCRLWAALNVEDSRSKLGRRGPSRQGLGRDYTTRVSPTASENRNSHRRSLQRSRRSARSEQCWLK